MRIRAATRVEKVFSKSVKQVRASSFPGSKEEASSRGSFIKRISTSLAIREGSEILLAAFGSGRDRRSFVIMSDTSSTPFAFKRRSLSTQRS